MGSSGGAGMADAQLQGGAITPYIASLQPGKSQMLFKGPIPKYKYEPHKLDRGLCIAGGSGITPMYQLISHSLGIKNDETKWTLIFSNVTEDDICESGLCLPADAERASLQYFGKSGTSWSSQIQRD